MPQKNKIKPKRWKDTHRTRLKVRVLGNETFVVHVNPEMTVEELRRLLELSTGIPYDIQRLTYLDEAELIDSSTIKDNEIVPGATIDLNVWHMWVDLVEKAIRAEKIEVMKLGVDPSIPYLSPLTDYMDDKSKLVWMKKRAFVVLCIAAHRQHLILCEHILPFVQNLNMKTPVGRTALHIAASQGKCEVIKLLLDKGAKMNLIDCDGLLAIDLAILYGHTEAERLISMLGWKDKMQRKQVVKKKLELQKSLKEEETVPGDIVPEMKTEIQEVQPVIVPPSEAAVEQEEIKSVAEVKTKADKSEENIQQLDDDNQLPAGYSRNPDSFRRYLMSLKKQSKHFGYAASIIDDHLQRLDNVKFHSFHRRELPSERDSFI